MGDRCPGYLIHFDGRGVYDANLGRVDISPEQAAVHNRLLDDATLRGLDENCQVGMRGTLYLVRGRVQTWTGVLVSTDVTVNGRSITFRRAGRTYQGRSMVDADAFNFKRVE